MRERATGMRATAEVSATLLSTWQACTVASDISEYNIWWSLSRWDKFLLKSNCINQYIHYVIIYSLFFSLSQQADLALKEAIRIAQESNDHVCLQHCLVKYFINILLFYFMSLLYGGWWFVMSEFNMSVLYMGVPVSLCPPSELALHVGTDEGIWQHGVNWGFSENGCPFLPASECHMSSSIRMHSWL